MFQPLGIIIKLFYRIFGVRYQEGLHLGIDLPAKQGWAVYAAYDGRVSVSGTQFKGYGSLNPSSKGGCIWLKHTDNEGKIFYTHYGHLKPYVGIGQEVLAGDTIGYISDFSNGGIPCSHLHFGRLNAAVIPRDHWGYNNKIGNFVKPL